MIPTKKQKKNHFVFSNDCFIGYIYFVDHTSKKKSFMITFQEKQFLGKWIAFFPVVSFTHNV